MVHQTSSSFNSIDAEVAELAGCSIEDSTEMKRRALEQQTVANRTTEKADRDSSDDQPSAEEEVDGQGNRLWLRYTCLSQ